MFSCCGPYRAGLPVGKPPPSADLVGSTPEHAAPWATAWTIAIGGIVHATVALLSSLPQLGGNQLPEARNPLDQTAGRQLLGMPGTAVECR
ncbi:hypothetical protein Ari01nite_87660 [Paractinoplanes rishiriensis]|uniref:Uncharacterized protein n=1 Tax=Paractinoplanes rishiriensis TaxID=1050105 RepID=A0A919MVD7_9ACTN|nr:hypothetical protein Ari01nite_87660 [Actinoplanes rishiriensis]